MLIDHSTGSVLEKQQKLKDIQKKKPEGRRSKGESILTLTYTDITLYICTKFNGKNLKGRNFPIEVV